ncbi:MAG: elongation factor 1-beta [Candidatus Nanoarchaeia archaeon]|nr:elongation factor 1-beta [Candidatus Nanoarchaeia archaeon]MDD5741175.1 elongation factor 1-beta [Candidatus Nanoarchaeia archaeon]
MGTALVKIKIMPESPKVNLKEIEKQAVDIAKKNKAQNPKTEIEPIAFGLNAIILQFAIDESESIDNVEIPLRKIKGVSSAEVADFRRAFG